jgi:hypothetical protein
MLVLRHRLAIAGVVTAAAVAVPAAALASGLGSPSGKPAPPQVSVRGAGKSPAAPSQLTALAASAGISVSQLQAGLADAKRDGGDTAASVAAFAASTGVSHATAQRVLKVVFGTPPSGKPSQPQAPAAGASKSAAAPSQVKQAQPDLPPAPVRAFAARLGVSTSAAGRAFKQIAGLVGNGIADPGSPAFAAIARDLGVSPAQLAAAWDAVR